MLISALCSTACGVEPDAGGSIRAIIGGRAAPEEVAVVELVEGSASEVSCSGVVIEAHVVLTAAHCLRDHVPRTARFVADGTTTTIAASRSLIHPDWAADSSAHDVGLVFLARAAPSSIPSLPIAEAPPVRGEVLRFVGFGASERAGRGGYGARRSVTASVAWVDALRFGYGVATCDGDSGGPALRDTELGPEIVGITGSGDVACASFGVSARADASRGWVLESLPRDAPVAPRSDPPALDVEPRRDVEPSRDAGCVCAVGSGVADAWALFALLVPFSWMRIEKWRSRS
ncbi:trypsin-like serine protease [Myxococcota bacterium]|nr:trypsin-like serine protease [Myxococcota bacterium]